MDMNDYSRSKFANDSKGHRVTANLENGHRGVYRFVMAEDGAWFCCFAGIAISADTMKTLR
jgi:hypothetical protein